MLDKEINIRFKVADVGKALLFSPVVVVLGYALICLPWGSENAPNWVQAIGSILAIAAGFAVVSYQDRVRESKRLEESWAYMHKTLQIAGAAVSSVDHVCSVLRQRGVVDMADFENHARLLQAAAEDVALVSFANIEDHTVAGAWIALRRCMILSNAAMVDAAKRHSRVNPEAMEAWSKEVNRCWLEMCEAINDFAARHGIAVD